MDVIIKAKHRWYLKFESNNKSYYLYSSIYLGLINGKPNYRIDRFHRVVTGAKDGEMVDHINHNTLDNRKSNLRVVDSGTNSLNRKGANKNSSTGVRNVSYSKVNKKYIVQMQINKENKVLGRFDTLEEAAIFAENKRKEIYGEIIK